MHYYPRDAATRYAQETRPATCAASPVADEGHRGDTFRRESGHLRSLSPPPSFARRYLSSLLRDDIHGAMLQWCFIVVSFFVWFVGTPMVRADVAINRVNHGDQYGES